MDNCTHTLIGVTLGNAVMAKIPRFTEKDRLAVIWTAALSSNLADFDFLLPLLMGEGKLGYLMHHRGHTHTFVVVPLMALLSVLLAVRFAKCRPRTGRGWLFLFGVAIMGAGFHIVADLWNDYGIHPFWPFANEWYYGDTIFIIEPLFLLSMIPLALLSTLTPWVRYFWGTLWVLLLTLIWVGPFARWDISLFLTVWAAAFFYAQLRNRRSVIPSVIGIFLTLATFFAGSQLAKANYREFMAAHLGDEKLVQLLTSPAPSNPFCWRIMSVSTAGDELIVRSGIYSHWPGRMNPSLCNYRAMLPGTANLAPVNVPAEPGMAWIGEFRASITEFRRLSRENCRFATLLRFARMPFWQSQGGKFPAGDLRYDFQPEDGFSEIDLSEGERCPRLIPPWVPPLEEVLADHVPAPGVGVETDTM